MRRVFHVQINTCIVGESSEEAVEVLLRELLYIESNGSEEVSISEVLSEDQIPKGWETCVPWGPSEGLTVSQLLNCCASCGKPA